MHFVLCFVNGISLKTNQPQSVPAKKRIIKQTYMYMRVIQMFIK